MRSGWAHWRLLLFRLGVPLLLLSVLRCLFAVLYRADFPAITAWEAMQVAVQGIRYDMATVVILNAPLILLHVLPFGWRNGRVFQRVLFTAYMLINGTMLLICSIDLAFFGFNNKRVGRDLLGQLGAGVRNLPSFLVHYAWVPAVFMLLLVLLWKLYPRLKERDGARLPWWKEAPVSVASIGLFVLLGRGGWQYQGLSPASAADHVDVALAPLVTNSAFTFGYSLTAPEVRQRNWFTPAELDVRMPLRYVIRKDSTDRKENVVLIIVESMGREYLGTLGHVRGYMPFMDSLAQRSLVFGNAFANAERSNKSMCAILAGIPSFTDDAFMNTAYMDNKLEGLGTRMKQNGYATSFFHGGLNGEYKFDSFSRATGFDRYYGRNEYGHNADYDGHWGIYDEEFLQYFANKLDQERSPFCSVVFTLSSHDPFPIPAKWKGHFPKGTQEIHESLGYVDMALRRFFERAAHSPWYRNTLFVITGDHTFLYNVHPPWYTNAAGRFAVPIIFFRPDGSLHGRDSTVAQHMDILPSILDITGFDGAVNCFGRSLFKHDREPNAAQYLNGQYQLIEDDRLLFFNGEQAKGLYAYKGDTLFRHDLSLREPAVADSMKLKLQAVVQRHAEALRDNKLALP